MSKPNVTVYYDQARTMLPFKKRIDQFLSSLKEVFDVNVIKFSGDEEIPQAPEKGKVLLITDGVSLNWISASAKKFFSYNPRIDLTWISPYPSWLKSHFLLGRCFKSRRGNSNKLRIHIGSLSDFFEDEIVSKDIQNFYNHLKTRNRLFSYEGIGNRIEGLYKENLQFAKDDPIEYAQEILFAQSCEVGYLLGAVSFFSSFDLDLIERIASLFDEFFSQKIRLWELGMVWCSGAIIRTEDPTVFQLKPGFAEVFQLKSDFAYCFQASPNFTETIGQEIIDKIKSLNY